MREILFRGKEIDTGEWLYGFYHNEKSIESPASDKKITHHHIYTQDFDLLVDPATIGQYTGLKDKNGKKIFEGDIVGCFCNTQIFQIKWCDVRGGYFLDNVVMCGGSEPAPECLGNLVDTIEVIGNVFDNGDLTIEN